MSSGVEPTQGLLAALGALSRSRALAEGRRQDFLAEATRSAAERLDVARVGVWVFDAAHQTITCAHLHRRGEAPTSGDVLHARDYPAYFSALEADPLIRADDARTDPRTREFGATYPPTSEVGAMLDAPIRRGPTLSGVICHEHVGGARVWTSEEMLFATALGDLVALAFEIAARREEDARARTRDQALEVALAATQLGIWRWDTTSGDVAWGGAMATLMGWPAHHAPAGLQDYLSRVHPDDVGSLQLGIQSLLDRTSPSEAWRLRHRVAGLDVERWVEVRAHLTPGAPDVIAGTLADVTAQQALEHKLLEVQQLEMLGQLAGGIAHNFNNLLAVVTGYADLLGPLVADRPDAARYVTAIAEASDRSAEITRQLLALTRSREPTQTVIDVAALGARVTALLRPLMGAGIHLHLEAPTTPALVEIDVAQLEQVAMNLVLNARDAVVRDGNIRVAVRQVTLTSPLEARPRAIPAGRWVVLEVRDDGVGMPPAVETRAFEPFFTTRAPGRGSGLGLATCLAIVTRAGGGMQLASTPGRGTVVTAWLPWHDPAPVSPPIVAPPADSRVALVIDDQRPVADLLLRVLARAGWRVEAVGDGEAAITAAARLERLDLVVSDVMIPGRRGAPLLAEIRAQHPDVAVVYVSGYTADELSHAGRLPPGTRFVAKPFRPTDIVQAAEAAMADVRPRAP